MSALREAFGAPISFLIAFGMMGAPAGMFFLRPHAEVYTEVAAVQASDRIAVYVPSVSLAQGADGLDETTDELEIVAPEPPPPPAPEPVAEVAAAEPEPEPALDIEPVGIAIASDDAPASMPRQLRAAAERMASRAATQRAMASAESKVKSKKSGNSGRKRCEEPTEQIVQLSDDSWSIERDLILFYASDLKLASKLASVAWARDDRGKIEGFSVRRIRCGTILDQAGLQSGDIVHEVNGKPVKTLVQAWGAWRKVKRKDKVRVTISRGGKKIRLEYTIT